MPYTESDYDVTALGDLAEDGDYICPDCKGSGIGQFGDPMTSRCRTCGGGGGEPRGADDDQGARADEAYERWREAREEAHNA